MKDTWLVGPRAITEALRGTQPIDKVWVVHHRADKGRLLPLLKELKTRGVPCLRVQASKLQHMVGAQHQGIVARAAAVPFAVLSEVLIDVFEQGKAPLLCMVERCTDVRNVGAIARSAEALGAHALVLEQEKTAALGQDSVRASAGALLHVPVCRVSSLRQTSEELQAHGVQIVAAAATATKSCSEVDLSLPVALLVGGEEKGLRSELWQAANEQVCIPMQGEIKSLNVAAAAAILLYEACRQRKQQP